jgi:hypothetical protein
MEERVKVTDMPGSKRATISHDVHKEPYYITVIMALNGAQSKMRLFAITETYLPSIFSGEELIYLNVTRHPSCH